MRRVAEIVGLVLLACGSACGGSEGEKKDPQVDCSAPIPTFTELRQDGAFAVCTNCHSSLLTTQFERQDAPVGVDFDTYAFARAQAKDAAKAVHDGSMPKPPNTLTTEHRTEIVKWGLCGAPE